MAKVSLNKLTPIKGGTIIVKRINDIEVEIRQYLSTDEKIALTERVLAQAFDNSNQYSQYRLDIITVIEMLKAYTNINFTEKVLSDIPKLYDLIVLNHLDDLLKEIPEEEYNSLVDKIQDEADNLQRYLNSLLGVMKTITTDYSNTQMNVDELTEKLNNPEALKTVKEILDKIG